MTMTPTLKPVRNETDILPAWRGTPVGELLAHLASMMAQLPALKALELRACVGRYAAKSMPKSCGASLG